jgi:exopolysaccharide production protein ExoZ
MTEAPDAPARFTGVQVLRFVAALLVVITHATLYAHERLTSSQPVWHFGEVGVDVFFVISGFVMLVSSRALTHRRDGWKYFAMRRIIRIVPIYWIATTVKFLTMVVGGGVVLHAALGWNVPLSYLFLPSTNVDGQVEPLLGVGWTLTFEMFFYALFTVGLLLRVDPLRFCGVLLTGVAIVGFFRTDDWPAASTYCQPRVLYFLAGMIIARFAIDRVWPRAAAGLGYVAVLFVALQVGQDLVHGNGVAAWDDVLRPVAAIALVLCVVLAEPYTAALLPAQAVTYGDASYSLYLFHPLIAPAIPVGLAIIGWPSPVASLVLTIPIVLAASLIIYRFLERPLTKLLQRRLPYGRSPRAHGRTPDAAVVRGVARSL